MGGCSLGETVNLDKLCTQLVLAQSRDVNLWLSLRLRLNAAAAARCQSELLTYMQPGNAMKSAIPLAGAGCMVHSVQHKA